MRRILVPALAALVAAGVPAAVAAPADDVVAARCRFSSISLDREELGGPDHFRGIAEGVAVVVNPGAGTFRCDLRVNGVTQASTMPTHGETLLVTAGPIEYVATEVDVVEFCEHVDFDDGHVYEHCQGTTIIQIPPECLDLVSCVFDVLNELVVKPADVVVCAALIALAPGVPGVVDIDPTGDTYLLGEFLWDCPPYGG